MVFHPEHDLHRRRRGRNIALGLVLALFVALVFGLSIAKIENGDMMGAFDHTQRSSALPLDPDAALPAPGPAPAAATLPVPGPAPAATGPATATPPAPQVVE